MMGKRGLSRLVLATLVVGLAAIAPAGATTLIRMGLDQLVAGNSAVVVGRVLDIHSYWNADGTFILSDVRIAAEESLKGAAEAQEIKFTVMGGTVGELSTVIVGGPELVPDRSYLLFLNPEDLPGARGVLTVRDLCQGIFDIVGDGTGPRAVSQATRHPLLPDGRGNVEAPGGTQGLRLADLTHDIRRLAGR